MRRLTLLLLLLISTSVLAEWTRVVDNSDGDMTIYIDYRTIKKKNNKVRMWWLFDYKTIRKVKNYRYLSQISRMEYDCEEEILRGMDMYWYSKNMRKGEIIYSYENIKHEPKSIIPESINETLFKIACGKK